MAYDALSLCTRARLLTVGCKYHMENHGTTDRTLRYAFVVGDHTSKGTILVAKSIECSRAEDGTEIRGYEHVVHMPCATHRQRPALLRCAAIMP